MLCETAILAAEVAGVGEQIVHGESGLLFAAGDWEGLAEHLARLIDDPALRATFAQAARQRLQSFSVPKMTELTLQAYRDLLGEPRPKEVS